MVSINSLTQNGFDLLKCAAFVNISFKSFSLSCCKKKSNSFTESGAEQLIRPVSTSITVYSGKSVKSQIIVHGQGAVMDSLYMEKDLVMTVKSQIVVHGQSNGCCY